MSAETYYVWNTLTKSPETSFSGWGVSYYFSRNYAIKGYASLTEVNKEIEHITKLNPHVREGDLVVATMKVRCIN